MALTALQVRHAKPGRHADGGGLYLLVKPSGAKSWVLRLQSSGRRRDFGLGAFPLLGLQEAREKALQGRKWAKAGLDPSLEWKRANRFIPTFEEAAREYHQTLKTGWRNGKHQNQWISTLERYAFPLIGRQRVDLIDAHLIQSVLIPIWLPIPETARRVRQRVASVLDHAMGQGWRSTEAPMRAVNTLMKGIKQPSAGNFAAMPYKDVPAFVAELHAKPWSVGRLALEFLILTAARSGEVRGAAFNEIDWEAARWTIPATRMKMKTEHTVPLSAPAMKIVRDMKERSGDGDGLIFPGLRGNPMSDMTLAKVLTTSYDRKATVHGFRSAFRDWAAECTPYPGAWAEAALAHSIPNKTEAAYRRTTFVEQRGEMMSEWARFVEVQ